MNIELLQKTQEYIKANPERIEMRAWVRGNDAEGNPIYPYMPAELPTRLGVKMCVSAIAAAIWNATERKENEPMAIYASGPDLLGIESVSLWNSLVLISRWPEDLGVRYAEDSNDEERSAATVERIQRLIDSQAVPAD